MKIFIALLLILPIIAGCATPSQIMLDAEVKRLCAIDGGIKVYETVKLPAEKFNQWGQPNFYRPVLRENALGDEFVFKQETYYYKQGNPEMSRSFFQVIRRSDNKLLGEVVVYGRGGGDLPGPGHGSSFDCPEYPKGPVNTLLMSVFIQLNKEPK